MSVLAFEAALIVLCVKIAVSESSGNSLFSSTPSNIVSMAFPVSMFQMGYMFHLVIENSVPIRGPSYPLMSLEHYQNTYRALDEIRNDKRSGRSIFM